ADHVLWLADARDGADAPLVRTAREALAGETPFTLIRNKVDLTAQPPSSASVEGVPVLRLSALTGAGVEALVAHLKALAGWSGEVPGTFTARARHLEALERAACHLERAQPEIGPALEIA